MLCGSPRLGGFFNRLKKPKDARSYSPVRGRGSRTLRWSLPWPKHTRDGLRALLRQPETPSVVEKACGGARDWVQLPGAL